MRTPLFDEHVSAGARMVDFAGWEMPLLYAGIIPEHHHTRKRVSIFDICHMGEFEVSGKTAEKDLERLLTQSVANIPLGGAAYGYLLDEQGGTIDDLICFRLAQDRFWLVVNAGTTPGDAAWIRAHLSPTTRFEDLSAVTAKLDIQGPESLAALEQIFPGQIPALKYFRAQEVVWHDTRCLLSRTGYTGEWGYELYLPVEKVRYFWRLLLQNSAIKPAGLGARDTLRMEMGYPLYGHELNRNRTPAGAAQGRFLDFSKDFIGRAAVESELNTPHRQQLVGFLLEGRMAARAGDAVFADGRNAGTITSGLFAPSLNRAAALGYISAEDAVPDRQVEIETRGKRLPAVVAALPLYTAGTARKRPGDSSKNT